MLMFLKFIFLCFLLVNSVDCDDNEESPESTNLSDFHNDMKQLLELCFPDKLNPAVITVDLIDIMFEISINEVVNASIVTIDYDFKSTMMKWHYPNHPSYILSAESDKKLKALLHEIKSSIIWNVESLVFVVGENCGKAMKVLRMVWDIEALGSFYVCRDQVNKSTLVYTFNPYTDKAPEPWSRVKKKTSDNRWTLYRQAFKNDSESCQSYHFDKTRILDGFPVKGYALNTLSDVSSNEFTPEALDGQIANPYFVFENIFSMLNVTPVMHYCMIDDVPHSVRTKKLFNNDKYDVWLKSQPLDLLYYEYLDIIPLYSEEEGYMIVTNSRSVPILEEIADSMFSYQTLILSIIILTSIFVLILINNKFNFIETLFDILLLVLNMGMTTPIERLFMRITFLATSLFILMFNPALEGQLMAMLAKPSYRRVENLDDLHSNEYQVFFDDTIREYIADTQLWSSDSDKEYLYEQGTFDFGRCYNYITRDYAGSVQLEILVFDTIPFIDPVPMNDSIPVNVSYPINDSLSVNMSSPLKDGFSEFDSVTKDSLAACIFAYKYRESALGDNLYISKDLLFKSYNVFMSRKRWSLKNKIDKAAMNLFETGHIHYAERFERYKKIIRKRILAARLKSYKSGFDQLEFEDFRIVYLFGTLSLMWTITVFIFEILFKKMTESYDKRLRKLEMKRIKIQRKLGFINKQTAFAETRV
ncbi:uncharacterized protein LOC130669442 [Microplitis mediator]|uniref:uncharacterized protein LOC130669442 n=1 Tax=Microplitis mediator TaxID=375433 RepID=UPI002557AE46|nr:uncharacterized protein LOC130669442 [Microplitis mediator]